MVRQSSWGLLCPHVWGWPDSPAHVADVRDLLIRFPAASAQALCAQPSKGVLLWEQGRDYIWNWKCMISRRNQNVGDRCGGSRNEIRRGLDAKWRYRTQTWVISFRKSWWAGFWLGEGVTGTLLSCLPL